MTAAVRALLVNWKLLLIVVLLAAAFFYVQHLERSADSAGYARSQAEYAAAAELQRESNRGRAHQAEVKEAAQTVYRDRYITRTVKEIEYVTQDLAACPVPPAAVRMLNDAAKCASEDRPASCGAHGGVRSAG
ncbi:hypothetical protein [Variovorax sp. UMC13]|uniref:hypothetical protein n=1 Tax=Variovorax sp. UMC13 TaxID=1862326 RepID=UPI0016031D89|nr:hypothetical protein [Variovorax sp. UMC13]MBB1601902.1 hypothetical protein [Variovorax sp. UMC13]